MFDSIDGMRISLPTDDNGFTGRECPVEECEGYYKIKFGTGVMDEGYDKCYCPYCGHASTQDQFLTKEQVSYIKSIALREVEKAIGAEVKKWDRNLRRSTKNSFIKLRVDYKHSYRPISHYAEQELETHLTCENCTLEYTVFGKFDYCPDCGVANTLQILSANLDLVRKLIAQAKDEENKDFQEFLVHNALEDIVSAFDSFGRNSVRLFTKNTDKSDFSISFQNITKAYTRIQNEFGFDFLNCLQAEGWEKVVRNFQKRNLISHNDGIVDDAYLQITNDPEALLGRKISVSVEDIEDMLSSIETIAQGLQSGFSSWKSSVTNQGDNDA